MILPTRAQLERLVPHAQWQEPDYKHEQWKYDPPLVLAWDTLTLQRTVQPSQQLAQGVLLMDIAQYPMISAASHPLAHLIDILYEVGSVLRIERGCITTLSLAALQNSTITKIVIMVASDAQVTCIDDRTIAQNIQGASIEIYVHAAAQFHFKSQQTVSQAQAILQAITIVADEHSTVTFQSWHEGTSYTKTFVTVFLQGAYANIAMKFGGALTKSHYYSLITEQRHEQSHTVSSCTVKLVHYDQSRSAYDGRIIIENKAVKSEAYQEHKALLTSEHARAYARPTLEAKTNDIQCGHGSAIGILDQEQLWYLQSRGIEPYCAQEMLVKAFFQDFV